MAASAHKKVNILLVDDQPARLLSYQTILEELNQNLITARSGLEALERLMKDDFALVLLDVSMPGMDGFETAAMIHDHPRFERTPIIFVTGVHDTEFDRLKGYKVGAVDYVSIPIVPEILRSKVSVLVELHLHRIELQELNESLSRANTALQVEKTRELEVLNRNLKAANGDLAQANRALQGEIAERRRAEVALKDADRRKDEFLAILAHELRNPLAPIRNAVEIMARVVVEHPQVNWAREVIDRQSMHLTRLVDDLLDISRITRGVIKLAREPVSIGTVVSRAVEALQPLIVEYRHRLTVDCPDDSLVVVGDMTRLTQVLGNLLNNAVKYTNPGGHIELTVQRSGDWIEMCVQDDGIGIPEDSVSKLFHLFSRLKGTEDRTAGGLGIGLALVRTLVEMHGGEVSVASAGLNCGSAFTVRLPLAQVGTVTPIVRPLPEPVGEVVPRRILIADDNQDALDTLALLLEVDGHEVRKAADGAAALRAADQWRPELIFLDIGMPVMDGYAAARSIRAEPWGKDLVLIALSGWGQREDMARSRDAGFDLHLVKPVSADAIAKVLSEYAPNVPPASAVARD
jgi:signal transduction histidine kinase